MKRIIGLISTGLLILSASLVSAQQITVSRGQTFTVHVNVYKPENVSFPSEGAELYAFLYKPSATEWTTHTTSDWWKDRVQLYWGNEERQENLSVSVRVPENAPAGETLYLRVRLALGTDSVWENSGVVLTMNAVEVNEEKTELSVETICTSASAFSKGEQGTPYWHSKFNFYAVDTAISDVLIAAETGISLPMWAIVAIVVSLVLIITIAVVVSKKRARGGAPSPGPLKMPRE